MKTKSITFNVIPGPTVNAQVAARLAAKKAGQAQSPIVIPKSMYKVVKLSNTTQYAPGDLLTQQVVDRLCKADDWDVTLT